MSTSSDLEKNLERWKDKYFEQRESFDEELRLAEEYASLLQRLLVRVSLAAENVNTELDSELDSLRIAIRSATPQKNDLAKRLKRIDNIILSTDEVKQQNTEKVVESMQQLIDQLLPLKIPRAQKGALRKLSKSVSNRASNFQEYPGILSEYALLQAESLKKIADSASKTGGFFGRFWGGGMSGDAPKREPGGQGDDSHSDTDLQLEVELAQGDEDEIIPGYYAISAHIRGTLNHLLNQLSFPESASREAASLRSRIATELNWYELGPTLDDLASLVISVVGKGQRDFENFLMELDHRLGKVQDFLSESQQADQDRTGNSKAFGRAVREHVNELTLDVNNTSDIEDLKQSITDHLDRISKEMDSFSAEEQQRENEKQAELKLLQERLKSMEHETQYIRKRLKEERSKALTDVLTALPNREAYDERLELELERWKRYRKPATLVVADIDHFKSINDNYGHLAGDKVLQIMAKEIQRRIRKTDFVARYGGEEFVIILPETSLDVAKTVIEKTREMISRLPFHFRDERIQITMSFGMTAFEGELAHSGLFDRADRALYNAKNNNRNCVEVWSADEF